MTIQRMILKDVKFFEDRPIALDDRRKIHDLGQSVNGLIGEETCQIISGQCRAAGAHWGCGDTTGSHKHDTKRQAPALFGHKPDAGQTRDVGDFMRIGDDRRDAARDDRDRELGGDAQAAFDVDVCIDQPGGNEGAFEIDRTIGPVVRTQTGDAIIEDCDVGLFDFTREDIYEMRIAEKQVGRCITARDSKELWKAICGHHLKAVVAEKKRDG